jgi:hypothetical protein
MKLRTLFTAAALTALFAAAPVVAHADHYGDWDEHHAWHDAPWWYHHHPDWVWYHHPEWVNAYPDWRPYYGDWMKVTSGTIAIGGTPTTPSGSANIITTGYAGIMVDRS